MADVEVNLESTDAKELLKCGHHAYITHDYANSAAALGKATQIMAKEHGDEHDSLGEVYLYYARALLELSREEAEPLGDAIPQGDEDSDSDEQNGEDEGEDIDENEGEEAVAKGEEVDGESKEEKKEVEDKKEVADKEEQNEEKGKGEEKLTNGAGSEEVKSDEASAGPSTSNGTTDEATDATAEEAEPTDLQLAWEVLEVAKKIFTARGDIGKELLSQTLILLGEVGMESENFEDAAVDIQAGLELQETLYEKTSRKLAETQYKLGVAHATISNLDEAIKFFEKSIETLQARIELLKKTDNEASKKEIKEIEELMPEIKEKINDMNDVKKERAKVVEELADAGKFIIQKAEASESTSSPKEIKDISHLVKRKRKTEDTETNEINPAKKPTP